MFFKKGLPTGKILFYDDNKLLAETALNFDYSTQKATGEIKIFDTNSEDKKVVNIIYKNIDQSKDKFLDLDTMKPSLNWYVDNPLNIFSAVEVFKMGKKLQLSVRASIYFLMMRAMPLMGVLMPTMKILISMTI